MCAAISHTAEVTMTARQANVPLREVMALLNASEFSDAEREMVRLIVEQAYDREAYSSRRYREREAREFGSEWYRFCVDTLRKSSK
jgi:hypothetical protein